MHIPSRTNQEAEAKNLRESIRDYQSNTKWVYSRCSVPSPLPLFAQYNSGISYTWITAFLLEISESLLKLHVKMCTSEHHWGRFSKESRIHKGWKITAMDTWAKWQADNIYGNCLKTNDWNDHREVFRAETNYRSENVSLIRAITVNTVDKKLRRQTWNKC